MRPSWCNRGELYIHSSVTDTSHEEFSETLTALLFNPSCWGIQITIEASEAIVALNVPSYAVTIVACLGPCSYWKFPGAWRKLSLPRQRFCIVVSCRLDQWRMHWKFKWSGRRVSWINTIAGHVTLLISQCVSQCAYVICRLRMKKY